MEVRKLFNFTAGLAINHSILLRNARIIIHTIHRMVCGYPNRAKVLLNYRRNIPSDRVAGHVRKPQKSIRTLTTLPKLRDSVHLYLCMEPDSIIEVDEGIFIN